MFLRHLASFGIRLAFWLHLRALANRIQQLIRGEHRAPRAELRRFATPEAMTRWARARFDWRSDKAFLTPDWSSPPEVFQWRLENDEETHGDCDDYHAWCAEVLSRMPGITRVLRMSCWTWKAGHTTCTFVRDGRLYLVDYQVYEVESYKDALEQVRRRYEWAGELAGWVFEDVDLRPVAIWPRVPEGVR